MYFLIPHNNASYLLFNDYADWFSKVMEVVVDNQNVNFVVKPHPSAYICGEQESLIKELKRYNSKQIYLCPSNFNNSSLIDCCDLIITCQGTIALEMACFGIPAVVAGAGYFNGYDIVKEFSTSNEYLEYLVNLNYEITNQRLSEVQINDALQIYYYIYETTIVDKLFPNTIVLGNELKNETEYLRVMCDNLNQLALNLENQHNNDFYEIVKCCC